MWYIWCEISCGKHEIVFWLRRLRCRLTLCIVYWQPSDGWFYITGTADLIGISWWTDLLFIYFESSAEFNSTTECIYRKEWYSLSHQRMGPICIFNRTNVSVGISCYDIDVYLCVYLLTIEIKPYREIVNILAELSVTYAWLYDIIAHFGTTAHQMVRWSPF